jgi:periplasmic protein TonB
MPAYAQQRQLVRPRERSFALAAVVLVQLGLAIVLFRGFHVDVTRPGEMIQQLVEVTLAKPPPPLVPIRRTKPLRHQAAAPKAEPAKPGGSPGPQPAHAPPSVAPVIAVKPTTAPSGGGSGAGPALGAGSGGGTGGNGYGDSDGGTDLEQIAGEITPRDIPRRLAEAGIGGHVEFTFVVEPNGRVGRCTVTRSSGVPELDALTCRLIQQRFVYRPSTDRHGRPIADEVDGEHDWIARGR